MSDPVPTGFVTVTEACDRTIMRFGVRAEWADWERAMGSVWLAVLSGDLPVFVRDPKAAELFRVPPSDIAAAYSHWQHSFLLTGKIDRLHPHNGRRPIIRSRDIDQWLEQRTVVPAGEPAAVLPPIPTATLGRFLDAFVENLNGPVSQGAIISAARAEHPQYTVSKRPIIEYCRALPPHKRRLRGGKTAG